MGGVSPPPCHTPGWAGQCQSQLEPRMEAGGLPWREDEGRQPNSQALVDNTPHLTVLNSCRPLTSCPTHTPHHEQRMAPPSPTATPLCQAPHMRPAFLHVLTLGNI